MAIFKCKMCGGALEITPDSSVAVCTFCGTKQTLPRLDDEQRANLYDRANHFRRNNDYDKAMALYEQLLAADKTDAEAYWSILLCKYGVEYVEDPATHKMVPTINRAQYTSIFADEDFKAAIQYADGYQRDVYEQDAKAIDAIQKEIIAISQQEEPYDVFICYKETDTSGRRTQDSVLAQDLYYQLTNEGYKVFFSRITLESKLGTAYEPYIFAALNTAKVMVVIGTKPENFNAVWVRNEWARFLALIKNGQDKVLIPAYRDMDPYDLPSEFSHLQAQDMSKLGFMQDLIRGIGKILKKKQPVVEQTITVNALGNTDALVKRAYICIEDRDFDKADGFAEQILNINPELAEAYLIKLLVFCKLQSIEQLRTCSIDISKQVGFRRALKYANTELQAQLVSIQKDNADFIACDPAYQNAKKEISAKRWKEAIAILQTITRYKDSEPLLNYCQTQQEEYRKARLYAGAVDRGFAQDATETIVKESIATLQSLHGYRDSDEQITKLYDVLHELQEANRVAAEKAAKKKRLIRNVSLISSFSVVFIVAVIILSFCVFIPMEKYNRANRMAKDGQLNDAAVLYRELGNYKSSKEKLSTINAALTADTLAKNNINNEAISYLAKSNADIVISFDAGDGLLLGGSSVESVAYSKSVLEDYTPTLLGYSFVQWRQKAYTLSCEEDAVHATFFMEAVWEPIMYSIEYDLGGGYGENNPSSYYITDESFVLLQPQKEGFEFVGWTTMGSDECCSSIVVEKGSYGDLFFVAHWNPLTYFVKYYDNGQELYLNPSQIVYGETFTPPIVESNDNRFKFYGWEINERIINEPLSWSITSDARLTALWETTYTINCYFENADDDEYILDRSIIEYGLINSNVTPVVQEFEHYTSPSSLTVKVAADGSSSVDYYYKRELINVNCFSNNGDKVNPISVKYNQQFICPEAVRTGYTFDGWYIDANLTIAFELKTITSPTNIYAKWKEESATSNFIFNASEASCEKYNGNEINIVIPSYYANKAISIIGDNAFKDNNTVKTIVLPNSVLKIGKNAFMNCTAMDAIENITNLISIGSRSFYNCCSLVSLSLGAGVKDIGEEAFYGCTGFKTFTIPSSVTSIGNGAFGSCIGLTSISIPNSVVSIGEAAFENCISIESMSIPFVGAKAGKTAEQTYQYPFGYIFGTTYHTGCLETSQSYYGESVSTTVTSVYYIPSSLKSLSVTGGNLLYGALWNCSEITSIHIGEKVSNISNGVLCGCSSLVDLTIPYVGAREDVTNNDANQYPFGYIFGTASYPNSKSTYQAYYWRPNKLNTNTYYYIPLSLHSVSVLGGNLLYGAFWYCSGLTSISIGDKVKTIVRDVFNGCDSLQYYIYANAKYLGNASHHHLVLIDVIDKTITSAQIHSETKFIYPCAFKDCDNITTLSIPNSVISIGQSAFYDCSKLSVVTIGNSVKLIEESAFSWCGNLSTVNIGNSILELEDETFNWCGLTTINYSGTIEQWKAIKKGYYSLYGHYTVHCTDGNI